MRFFYVILLGAKKYEFQMHDIVAKLVHVISHSPTRNSNDSILAIIIFYLFSVKTNIIF